MIIFFGEQSCLIMMVIIIIIFHILQFYVLILYGSNHLCSIMLSTIIYFYLHSTISTTLMSFGKELLGNIVSISPTFSDSVLSVSDTNIPWEAALLSK